MGRVACIVPFCGRGCTKLPSEHDEYICPVHYPLVDRSLKLLRRRVKRVGRRHERLSLRQDGAAARRRGRAARSLQSAAGL